MSTLDKVMFISIEGPSVEDIDATEFIDYWLSSAKHSRHIFLADSIWFDCKKYLSENCKTIPLAVAIFIF